MKIDVMRSRRRSARNKLPNFSSQPITNNFLFTIISNYCSNSRTCINKKVNPRLTVYYLLHLVITDFILDILKLRVTKNGIRLIKKLNYYISVFRWHHFHTAVPTPVVAVVVFHRRPAYISTQNPKDFYSTIPHNHIQLHQSKSINQTSAVKGGGCVHYRILAFAKEILGSSPSLPLSRYVDTCQEFLTNNSIQ